MDDIEIIIEVIEKATRSEEMWWPIFLHVSDVQFI